jgi:hypothetical protein
MVPPGRVHLRPVSLSTARLSRSWAKKASNFVDVSLKFRRGDTRVRGVFLAPLATFASQLPFERMDPADALVLSGSAYGLAATRCSIFTK